MSRKPRGCRYKLVGIMGSGVDIVVLGVAIGVLVLNACVLSVDISILVYNRILAVDIAVLRRQKKRGGVQGILSTQARGGMTGGG